MTSSAATSPFDRLDLADLRRRTSAKWQVHPDDVLPLWVAEMDVVPPAEVVAAVDQAMRTGDTGYAIEAPYIEALQGFAATRWGWRFEAAAATTVADVMRGAMEVIEQVVEPGGPVIVSPPVYPPFFQFITHTARRVVEAPLADDGRLDLDVLDRVFAECSSAGRAAYLLCSPQNPTGTVHTHEELAAVRDLAVAQAGPVGADEIPAPVPPPGAPVGA
jgi:cysteine-S-conjugate beta-lyase